MGAPRQVNPEEGLVGADGLSRVTIDRNVPAARVRNRRGQDAGPRCRDPSADPIATELQVGQGVPLNIPHLLGVVAIQLLSDDPVLELVVPQLGWLEGQLLRQVAVVVADVQGAIGDVLEEREDVLLGLDNTGGSKPAGVVQLERDVRRTIQDVVAPVAVLVETLVKDAPRVIGHGLPVVHIVVDLLLHGEGRVLDFAELDVELTAPNPLAEGLALHLRKLKLVLLIAVDVLELGRIDRVEAVGN